MSNCYTEFYFELPLPSNAVVEEVSALLALADDYQCEAPEEQEKSLELLSPVFSEFYEYEELGFTWHVSSHPSQQAWSLCIEGEESGNVEHATELILWLLPKLDIKSAGFTYCEHGGGSNGGGAVAVIMTDDGPKAEWVNADSWLAEKLG